MLFSSDDAQLYFIKNNLLYSLNVITKEVSHVLTNYSGIEGFALTCDQEKLLFTSKENGSLNLYSLTLSTNTVTKLRDNT